MTSVMQFSNFSLQNVAAAGMVDNADYAMVQGIFF